MEVFIEIGHDELRSFDSPQHFKTWLLELHSEYDLEEIEELKQAFLELGLDNYNLICKEFEQEYLP